jgi:hypothetical protein
MGALAAALAAAAALAFSAEAPRGPPAVRRALQDGGEPSGCSDSLASNFDASATTDEGSCEYACEGIAADVWNATSMGLDRSWAGDPAATCEVITVLTDPPGENCCCASESNCCCTGCCGGALAAPASTPGSTERLVVQGVALGSHHAVVYRGSTGRTAGDYDIVTRLPRVLSRRISAGEGSFLSVRRIAVDLYTEQDSESFISALAGCLLVEDCEFERMAGFTSGVVTMTGGGEVHIKTSKFSSNTANLDAAGDYRSGGAVSLPDGGVLKVSWSIFQSNQGRNGGAIFVGGEGAAASPVEIDGSLLQMNSLIGSGRGGGLSVEAGDAVTVSLSDSSFKQNFVSGVAGEREWGGGAVWQKYGTLDVHGCSFEPPEGRDVSEGELLSVFELKDWRVVNTDFQRYRPCNGSSITDGCSVFTDGCPSAGCAEHPCEPGQRCEYRAMSLWCNDCVWPAVSVDGISCLQCPPGQGPEGNLTYCEECDDGKYSSYGTCNRCDAGKVPSIDKTRCVQCAVDHVSVEGLVCERCSHGWQANEAQSICEYCGAYGLEYYSPDGTPCRNCTAGTEPNATRGECLECSAGFYSPDGKDCVTCDPGQEPDLRLAATHCRYCNVSWYNDSRYSSGGRECIPCWDGSRPVPNHTACEPCPAGMAGRGGTCEVCEPGQQPDRPHHDCLDCSDSLHFGENTHSVQGIVCEACPPGREPNAERTTCDVCPSGKYSNVGICERCNAGYEPNLDLGAVNCSSCAFAGRGMISSTGLECSSCLPGYEPSPDHTACVPCDDFGEYFFSTDGTKCQRCLPGFEVNEEASDCTECGAGRHSREGARCLHCDNYTSASYSLERYAECETCPAGKSPNEDRSECVPCSTGYQSPDGTPCVACPPGQEANPREIEGVHCTACLENLFSQGNGTLCTQCPSGQEPTEGHDGCSDCLPGFAGIDGVCQPCAKGQQPDSSAYECIDCVPSSGTFSVDGVQCRSCPAGKQPNVGSTQCDSCYPGRHSADGISCEVCDLGTEPNIAGIGATGCVPCVGGVSAGDGGGCDKCPAGSEPNAAATGCELCPAGTHSTEGVCVACQPGYEPNMEGGATGCVQCVGTYSEDGSLCRTCGPGSHPIAPVAAASCEMCADVRANAYSEDGMTCDLCPPGHEVDAGRTTCTPCMREEGYHSIDGSICSLCPAGSEPTAVANGCASCAMSGEAFVSTDGAPCTQCAPGSEPNTDRTECELCAPGFVSAHGAPCLPCDRGMEPQVDGRACNGCPSGKFSGDGTPCQYCPGGFEPNVDRTQCAPCVNQVSGPTTAHMCQSCQAGKQMADSTSCEQCQAGSASIDGLGCQRCDPGTAPDAGNVQCVPCASGTFSTDGIRCLTCQPGEQPNLAAAATFCQLCSAISASAYSSNGLPCQSCPAGTQRNPDATACIDCTSLGPGLVSLNGAECTACQPGAEPSVDRSRCIACEGIERVSINGTGCVDCPSGWLANEPKTDCFPCTMSGYLEAATTGVCMVQFGTTVPLAGGAACEMCMPGGDGIGDPAYCRTCGIGYAKEGDSACMLCEQGKVSLQGEECTACPAGKTSNELRSACRPCEVYEIYDTFSRGCATCGAGAEVGSGQYNCVQCPEGKYSDDDYFCKNCMAGKSPDETLTACELCPPNFASATGTNCTECKSGYTHSPQHTECLLVNGIPPGTVSWLVFVAFTAGLALSCVAGWCNRSLMSHGPEEMDIPFEDHGSVDNPLAAKGTALLGLVGRHPVDLVFVVGCTDSMGKWVDLVTASIQPLAAALRTRFGESEIRFGFVGFRDYAAKQDVKRFEIAELTDHFTALRAFLATVQAVSPPRDDGPDDVTGALEKCTELHWRQSTRVVLVLSDTPCHGAKYHGGIADHFPAGDPIGLNPETIVSEMSRNEVHLYFGRISSGTDQMIATLRTAYESTAGRWSKFGAMDATSWPSDPSRFADVVVDLVTRSVSHTVRHHRENQLHPPGRGAQPQHKLAAEGTPQTEQASWRDYAQRLHGHQGHPSQAPKVPLPADRLRTSASRALAASAFGSRGAVPAQQAQGPPSVSGSVNGSASSTGIASFAGASIGPMAGMIPRAAPQSLRPPPPPPPVPSDSSSSDDPPPPPPPRPAVGTAL